MSFLKDTLAVTLENVTTCDWDNAQIRNSQNLFRQACAAIPGGVNSPVRAFRAVGGTPRFITSAQGCWVNDADDNCYVDLVCSWGPMILGHGHPRVLSAIHQVVDQGLSFGAPTQRETELAEEIIQRVQPVEKIRFVNSGTEATMSALRLARGVTRRDKFVKFSGCYHGHSDAFLVDAGSGVATLGLPASPGVPQSSIRDTFVVDYNDIDALEALFSSYGDSIAAVITEAAPGNMGVVPPNPGFNKAIRSLTQRYGALMICDEVMTGFRVSASGWYGLDPVEADLFTFGKVMGGGLPAAAFGGKACYMDQLAPLGSIYQAGTLSGNPLATAAGLATLRTATSSVYQRLDQAADRLTDLLIQAFNTVDIPYQIQRAGNMLSVFFSSEPVRNFRQAQASQTYRYPAFFHSLLQSGVYVPPSPFEAWFVSSALDDDAFDIIASALPCAVQAAAQSDKG